MAMLPAAMRYARAGIPVVPLFEPVGDECSCGRADCDSAGKHPRTGPGGFKHATAEVGQLRFWWGKWPAAGIGIPTGITLPSGGSLLVLDVDPKNDGDDALRRLEATHGEIETYSVRTGSGGLHFYFRDQQSRPTRTGLFPGIDVKARGGYVVAPPSLHRSGQRYQIERSTPLAPVPSWLVDAMEARPTAAGGAPALNETIPQGFRDTALTSVAGSMRFRGLVAEEILPALKAINARRCQPPLPDSALERIARSVARLPAKRPLFGHPETAA